MAAGGRSATNGLVGENVYMPINGGEFALMPRYECDAVAAGFNKGGCFDGMGKNGQRIPVVSVLGRAFGTSSIYLSISQLWSTH